MGHSEPVTVVKNTAGEESANQQPTRVYLEATPPFSGFANSALPEQDRLCIQADQFSVHNPKQSNHVAVSLGHVRGQRSVFLRKIYQEFGIGFMLDHQLTQASW